jgi:GNAT superfamily N-acetyltransferase
MIRWAESHDAEEIAAVHVQCWHETYTGLVSDEELLAMTNYESRLASWNSIVRDETQITLLALDAEKVIGFVNGGKAQDKLDGYDGELYRIYLLKSYHGKGLGRQLMQVFAQELECRGFKAFYLWVLDTNPTRSFYEHLDGLALSAKNTEYSNVSAYGWPSLEVLK